MEYQSLWTSLEVVLSLYLRFAICFSRPQFVLVPGQFLLKLLMLVVRELVTVFPSCPTALVWFEERLREVLPLCGWGAVPIPCLKGKRKGHAGMGKIPNSAGEPTMIMQDHFGYLISTPLGLIHLVVSIGLAVTSHESKTGTAVRGPLCLRAEASVAGC